MSTQPDWQISEKHLEDVSWKLARQCRYVIQACLREEEWIDADQEFHDLIRAELVRLMGKTCDSRRR